MPIRAQAADGTVHEFPDGTSGDVVDRAMKGYAQQGSAATPAAPSPPAKSFIEKLGDTWPAKLAKGAFSAATLPGDVYKGNTAITGADGHTNPEVIGRSAELAALAGPAAPGVIVGKAAVPTLEALHAAASASYKEASQLGVELSTPAMGRVVKSIEGELKIEGERDFLAPKTFKAIQELNTPAGKNATLDDIDAVRKLLGRVAADPNEKRAAAIAIRRIDEYLENIPKDHVIKGDFERASEVLRAARGNYASAKRSELVTGALEKADRQAAKTGSGANINNTMRQRIDEILNNPKKLRGFSAEEIAQMRQIVEGTFTGNAARLIGKLAPTGVISAAPTAGAVLAGRPDLAAVLLSLGLGGKTLGDFLTRKGIRDLDRTVRERSSLFKETPVPPSVVRSGVPFENPLDAALRSLALSKSGGAAP